MAARWRGKLDHSDDFGWRPYVTQAERRRKALARIRQLEKIGQQASPVAIRGRRIATTFWGSAWCENLERYSDYANRLPRGRTYVRNGSLIDLRIGPGTVEALVCGSSIYRVRVDVSPVAAAKWKAICRRSAGGIASLVELLQGRFSDAVMEHMCRPGEGLFPTPGEIRFSCSCPDWAYMCKHVSAVLYGIGARLDESPELLFRLRRVDERDLIAQAGEGLPVGRKQPASQKVLSGESLSEVFGVELAAPGPEERRAGKGRKPAAAAPQEGEQTAVRRKKPAAGKRNVAAAPPEQGEQTAARKKKPAAGKRNVAAAAARGKRAANARPAGKSQPEKGRRAPKAKPVEETGRRRRVAAQVPEVQGSAPAGRASKTAARRPDRPAGKGTLTPAMREAISERMKRYWAERRREAAKRPKK